MAKSVDDQVKKHPAHSEAINRMVSAIQAAPQTPAGRYAAACDVLIADIQSIKDEGIPSDLDSIAELLKGGLPTLKRWIDQGVD